MRTRTAAIAAGTLGLVLSQTACGEDATDGGAPAPDVAPSPAAESGAGSPPPEEGAETEAGTPGYDDAFLDGERQFVIQMADRPNIMVVNEDGQFGPGDRDTQWHLFVLAPHGETGHLIQTAESGEGGEPFCLGLDAASSPATVVAALCDASRDGQIFTVEPIEAVTGEPAYAISSQGAYLRLTSDMRVVAEEGRDASAGSAFQFNDEGEAPARPGE